MRFGNQPRVHSSLVPQAPNQRYEDREDYMLLLQQPRNVTHSQIFWYRWSIPFTGTAAELISAYSESQGFDAIARGAWSDATNARVQIVENRTGREWSNDFVSVRSWFGNSNEVQPLLYWGTPVIIASQDTLRGDFINTNSEPARLACMYAEIIGNDRHVGDGIIRVKRSQDFRLRFDLSSTRATTTPVNSDILIWGATTNAPVTTLGVITNQSTNFSWSSQPIPLRAMAGVDGQVQNIIRYHRPYLLPANVKMRCDINTAGANQYLDFLCEKILE